jgi:hypothetical protein
LRVFENRVLRRTFGLKIEEVAGEWKRLHNEELHNLQSSLNNIRVMTSRGMRVHVAHLEEKRNACKIVVGKPEAKRSLVKPRRRWEDNINIDMKEILFEGVDWINLPQDRD